MCRVASEEILGVDKGSPEESLREAYRRLSKAVHPDAGGTKGLFVVLTDAYESLIGSGEAGHSAGGGGHRNRSGSGSTSGSSGGGGAKRLKTVTVEVHGPDGVIRSKAELFQLMRRTPGSVIFIEYIPIGKAPFTCDGESVPEGVRLVVKGGPLRDWYALVEFDGVGVSVK